MSHAAGRQAPRQLHLNINILHSGFVPSAWRLPEADPQAFIDVGHYVRVAQIAEDCGVQALAIHGRTRAAMYRGDAEHETVRAIKQSVGIPVFANGDIDSPLRAREILAVTGCDGIMIGRAAQGRPWIFDEVNFFLRTGKLREELAREKVRDIIRAHLEDLYDFYGDETGVRVARKHLSWYFRQHHGQEALRDRLMRIETPQEQLATLLEQYDTRVCRAA